MNTYTCVILSYISICTIIVLFVPIAKNKWRNYLRDFKQAYKKIGWGYQENQALLSLRTSLVKFFMIITFGILTLLFFVFTPFLLPFMVMYDKKKKVLPKRKKDADKIILEGYVTQMSPIRHPDDGRIYIVFLLGIYTDNRTQYYRIVSWNNLAKEVEKTVNIGCQVRVEGKPRIFNYTDDDGKKNQINEVQADHVEILQIENCLYFQNITGVGDIQCFECKNKEQITSFIHGIHSATTGYQCQSCGKFHSIGNWDKIDYCDCGGKLERDKPLFCPKCKSNRLNYEVIYMT